MNTSVEPQDTVKKYWKKELNTYTYWNISAYNSTTGLNIGDFDFMGELLMPINFSFTTELNHQVHLEKGELNQLAIGESIKFDSYELMQSFVEAEIQTKILEGYVEVDTEKDMSVLFVQIQGAKKTKKEGSLSVFFSLLDLRSDIEEDINNALKTQSLGASFASDMGADANILFSVYDFDKALQTVLKVLRKQRLGNRTLIAKGIENGYDVVYPKGFEGQFQSY